jgi:alanine racemase
VSDGRVEEGRSRARRALARVNLAAIERNSARLRGELGERCELCAVVKADGYGHGAPHAARAALAGGARWLAVAGAREALELRRAGLDGARILVMGALSEVELGEALAADADVVVWREEAVRAVARAGGGRVHVKLDSGMGRLGTRDREEGSRVVALARDTANVAIAGVMTHFATADDRDDAFFERQLQAFADWARTVKEAHPQVVVHAANSAATLRERRSHFDMVRCGIAVYGMDPFGIDPLERGLEPALELTSYVAEVKGCAAGQSAGYGRRFIAARDTVLGVLPIGYGDGWRRALSGNADVLIAAQRHPIVGMVSMDNLTVELGSPRPRGPRGGDAHGPRGEVDPRGLGGGDAHGLHGGEDPHGLRGGEAVLIGERGGERITAEEVAGRMGTINYEVTCALTQRVPRIYHRDGEPVDEAALEPPAGRTRPLGVGR